MKSNDTRMIYGANGFTGRLITREAKRPKQTDEFYVSRLVLLTDSVSALS
jgi:short subunit dehydrogenase-like uncharacterized protein